MHKVRFNKISIHFFYTEEDVFPSGSGFAAALFQSTSSIQRKTSLSHLWVLFQRHFNPLPLYRGRHVKQDALAPIYEFQSTSSIQRKTLCRPAVQWLDSDFNPLPLYRGRPQISTNKYPSIRLLISNFDIYAIILSTRFSKLTYILNKIFFFSKIHGANIPGFLCSLHIRTSISYSNKPLVFYVLLTLSTK